jgi:hypothetical protein
MLDWRDRGVLRALEAGARIAPILWRTWLARGSLLVVERVVPERGVLCFPAVHYGPTGHRTPVCTVDAKGRVKRWLSPALRAKAKEALPKLKPLLPSLATAEDLTPRIRGVRT